MIYQSTLSSAHAFAKAGKLEEWIHTYLLTDANNTPFSEGLKQVDRIYTGPYILPLSLFVRCCGPEEHMMWKVDAQGFEQKVQRLMQVITTEVDLPPLILHFTNSDFELNDGNHRFEAYRRLGIHHASCIVWMTHQYEYLQFIEHYAEYLDA